MLEVMKGREGVSTSTIGLCKMNYSYITIPLKLKKNINLMMVMKKGYIIHILFEVDLARIYHK